MSIPVMIWVAKKNILLLPVTCFSEIFKLELFELILRTCLSIQNDFSRYSLCSDDYFITIIEIGFHFYEKIHAKKLPGHHDPSHLVVVKRFLLTAPELQ